MCIRDREYTAYKISCETWTKTVIQIATSSDDKVVGKSGAKTAKKYNKKSVEITNAIGDNTQGYKAVSYTHLSLIDHIDKCKVMCHVDTHAALSKRMCADNQKKQNKPGREFSFHSVRIG